MDICFIACRSVLLGLVSGDAAEVLDEERIQHQHVFSVIQRYGTLILRIMIYYPTTLTNIQQLLCMLAW